MPRLSSKLVSDFLGFACCFLQKLGWTFCSVVLSDLSFRLSSARIEFIAFTYCVTVCSSLHFPVKSIDGTTEAHVQKLGLFPLQLATTIMFCHKCCRKVWLYDSAKYYSSYTCNLLVRSVSNCRKNEAGEGKTCDNRLSVVGTERLPPDFGPFLSPRAPLSGSFHSVGVAIQYI